MKKIIAILALAITCGHGSMSFTASDSRAINTTASGFDVNVISFLVWIYPTAYDFGAIFRLDENSNALRINMVEAGQDISIRYLRAGNRGEWLAGGSSTPSMPITLNTWTCIAISYDRTDTANDPVIYIRRLGTDADLIPVTPFEAQSPLGVVTNPNTGYSVGADNTIFHEAPFVGRIYRFQSWSASLSEAQFEAASLNPCTVTSNLLLCLADDGTDLSGGGRGATLVNVGTAADPPGIPTIPVISSASVTDDTISITGDGFGVKTVAAPFKFQPFTSTSQGQDYTQAGFDFVAGNNAGSAHNKVDMDDGVGGGSWLHITPGDSSESFSHFGHLLPDVNEVYASCWMRFSRIDTLTAAGGYGQIKIMRSGLRTGLNPVDSMYYKFPKVYPSLYDSLANLTDLSGPNSEWRDKDQVGGIDYSSGGYDVPIVSGRWQFCEIYYRMNTLGQANGILQVRFNGTLNTSLSNTQPRTVSGENFGYMQYCPGLAQEFLQSVWQARFSRIYLDTTQARVFLGNASTLAACTGRFILSPSSWSSTSITATSATFVPYNYRWVYVANRDGIVNANGYAITIQGGERSRSGIFPIMTKGL